MTDSSPPLSLLEIRLDAVCRNYLLLQKKLERGCDLAAAVKADAYGLGAHKVVPALYRAGCRHFYVAHAEEGIRARAVLPEDAGKAHVYVLHGTGGTDAEEFLRHDMTPVLNGFGDIENWAALARRKEKKLPAVLQLDTGMNRLGLAADEIARLCAVPDILQPLDLRYVMSHLACADEPAHPKNRAQLEKFKRLTGALGLPCRLSLANSAGIFLGTDYHFDQARPGCALYGINPTPDAPNPMQGVITLKARILQIRDTAAGETVGYGAAYAAARPVKLATISVGYADGLLRSFGKNGMVYIGGCACPLTGRVSMDLVVADVTGVAAQAGDYAEIVGAHQTADDVAAAAGTIGYEILTDLGRRYKRSYTG
ncbi:MAG: alanine racemase [Alphaproteobacteria bacterium]|nr:alanine racemase [Alphaproteobacteria bacterium]MDE2336274.1 alanine racemase [Alphaproteobacteria bacterium]